MGLRLAEVASATQAGKLPFSPRHTRHFDFLNSLRSLRKSGRPPPLPVCFPSSLRSFRQVGLGFASVGPPGIEPGLYEPESHVLPVYYGPFLLVNLTLGKCFRPEAPASLLLNRREVYNKVLEPISKIGQRFSEGIFACLPKPRRRQEREPRCFEKKYRAAARRSYGPRRRDISTHSTCSGSPGDEKIAVRSRK